eukprot:14950996-Alexandrium_andersonii.AAC.1
MMPACARRLVNKTPVNGNPSTDERGSANPSPPALDPRTHHLSHTVVTQGSCSTPNPKAMLVVVHLPGLQYWEASAA